VVRLGRRLLLILICATAMGTGAGGLSALAAEVDAVGRTAPTDFADIIEQVRPAVVGLRVKTEEPGQPGTAQQASAFPPGSPFDRFLRQFGITLDNPSPRSGLTLGSGFFISGDGYIVTNNHVIANDRSIEVTTDDGKVYPAKVIGTDPQTDLALVKIAAQADLPYVRLAKAEPRIGEWVLPIGNPFGLGGSVTAGIVSARGRDIGEGPYDDFIQIDAPVNEGNSGGPTFNVRGRVIGVNTAIYSPSGGSIGVAFDIPAETVKLVVQQLKDKGHITRGWIGVEMQSVTPTIAEALGLTKDRAL
jgi:serine protease Do